MDKNMNETMKFSAVEKENDSEARKILVSVYTALAEKGYNPVNQIVGYLTSGDLGYISNHKNARNKMKEFDRCEVVEVLLKEFQRNS